MDNYKDYTDQQLMALLKKNSDHRAFTEIFARYNSLLYIHAYKKFRNVEAAKDVVQDTLSALWYKHGSLEVSNNLGGYLYTTLKHKIFDLLARQQVGQKHIVALQDYLNHGSVLADHLVREKQLAAIIETEIAALPPRMREVFELSRRENLTHKQIAERMAIAEQTVTDQVKKALKILKPRIGLAIAAIYYLT